MVLCGYGFVDALEVVWLVSDAIWSLGAKIVVSDDAVGAAVEDVDVSG